MQNLADSAKLFIQFHEGKQFTPSTLRNCEHFFGFVLPWFEGKDFNINTWRDFMATKSSKSNHTINQYNGMIKSFLSWMEREEMITPKENFKERIDKLPTEKRLSVPSREVMAQIVGAIDTKRVYTCFSRITKEEVTEYVSAMKLMLHTGIRSGAIGSIKGVDIHALDDKPSFSFRNKGGTTQTLPIPPQCQSDMQERMKWGKQLAFQFKTQSNYQGQMNILLKEGVKLLGLNIEVKSHFFRHAYGTYLANETSAKIQDVSTLLCHSKLETTMKYIHQDMNHLSEVVRDNIGIEVPELMKPGERLDALISRIVSLGVNRKLINLVKGKIIIDVNGY